MIGQVSRQEARALGMTQYFTAKPCVHGHLSTRNVADKICRACQTMRSRARYQANPAALNSLRGTFDEAKRKRHRKAKYWADPVTARAKAREWSVANPDKVNAQSHRKRAAKRNAAGTHTAADVAAIRKAQVNKCAYCRDPLKAGFTHLDHIVALSRGGSNDRKNLQLTCAACNTSKKARDPIDYARSIGRLI